MPFSVTIEVPSPVLKELSSLQTGTMFIQDVDIEVGAPIAYVVAGDRLQSGDVPVLVMSAGQDVWLPLTLPGTVMVARLLNVSMTAHVESA